MSRKPKIAVLGAGISGISTAYEILKDFGNNVVLTIIAEEFVPDITSSMAAGLWQPNALSNTPEYLQRWVYIKFFPLGNAVSLDTILKTLNPMR